MDAPTWEDIRAARARIAPWAHVTPVVTCAALDDAARAHVFLKCEPFQRTGSFKFRGAMNAVSALPADAAGRGVAADSSGNHAQALALAARLRGLGATVVMPENASPTKAAAARGYGARVLFCPPTPAGRRQAVERLVEETGAIYVSPHDDPLVIAGQGTAAWELIEEIPDLDLMLAPVGGGGLLSGTLLAARRLSPRLRVIGCEPAGAPDAAQSLRSGQRVTEFVPRTVADGLRTPLGELPFCILRRSGPDAILLVSEEEILGAMRFVWERVKVVIEPSAAVAVAPLLSGAVGWKGLRVGVILSGGNVGLDRFFDELRGQSAGPG